MKWLRFMRRLIPRFSLRAIFVLLAIVGVICAYHANWIRQRHEFLALHQARLEEQQRKTVAKDGFCYSAWGDYCRKAPKSSWNLLWLLGEPKHERVQLVIEVTNPRERKSASESMLNCVCDTSLPNEEFELAEKLFPESDFGQLTWHFMSRSSPRAAHP